jgi:hypothetical protein
MGITMYISVFWGVSPYYLVEMYTHIGVYGFTNYSTIILYILLHVSASPGSQLQGVILIGVDITHGLNIGYHRRGSPPHPQKKVICKTYLLTDFYIFYFMY